MRRHRLLFLRRQRQGYWGDEDDAMMSSGFSNSVFSIVQMLQGLGVEAQTTEIVDSNSIDREVTLYRPTDVFLESIWCPPPKLDVLIPLHPHVRWIVRDHSETPFLAGEGMAISWLHGYLGRGIEVNCNSRRAAKELHRCLRTRISRDFFSLRVMRVKVRTTNNQ